MKRWNRLNNDGPKRGRNGGCNRLFGEELDLERAGSCQGDEGEDGEDRQGGGTHRDMGLRWVNRGYRSTVVGLRIMHR